MDATSPGLCHPQIVYLPQGAIDGGGDTEGGQDTKVVGLEYRKETGEESCSIGNWRQYRQDWCEAVGHIEICLLS